MRESEGECEGERARREPESERVGVRVTARVTARVCPRVTGRGCGCESACLWGGAGGAGPRGDTRGVVSKRAAVRERRRVRGQRAGPCASLPGPLACTPGAPGRGSGSPGPRPEGTRGAARSVAELEKW